jgi:Ca-activated chloride channel family protein
MSNFYKIAFISACFFIFSIVQVSAQYYLRGAVQDENGKPITGAKILVHSQKIFVYSGSGDGSFGILEKKLFDTLTISFEGYESKSFPVRTDQWQTLKLKSLQDLTSKTQPKLISLTKDLVFGENKRWVAGEETYFQLVENEFRKTIELPQTGYSLNVNKAAYSNVRRFINSGSIVPADAVRIEEMINYFNPNYRKPAEDSTFRIEAHLSEAPWNPSSRLLFVNTSAKQLDLKSIPPGNFVFLIDVSGSMDMPNRLPMLKAAFQMFVKNLRNEDSISIVTYGGYVQIWLAATSGAQKEKILKAIETLEAAGDTPGESAIRIAYRVARKSFIREGNNRIILATDGDFNVGETSEKALEEMVIKQRQSGVYLTCLGVGMGNFKDSKLQALAKNGNGNYAYIDDLREAERVLVKELTQTFYSVADDASLSIHFNDTFAQSYRLIGFDNQKQAIQTNQTVLEGGEVGSGSNVLAIFEWVPTARWLSLEREGKSASLASLQLQYRKPGSTNLFQEKQQLNLSMQKLSQLPQPLQFATGVTLLGLKIRRSKYDANMSWSEIRSFTKKIADPNQYLQTEFLKLLEKASKIYGNKKKYWQDEN